MHKFIVALLLMIAFCSGFFGRTLFDAYAEEEGSSAPSHYYTSIRLEPGDNLWKIADRYAKEAGYSVSQYVEELKRINQLPDGQVHSGKYLTIVYLSE
ncbi:LysM peptidoglycan-binding domain-containing protein [Clostridiaceae bacterium]|nr:LysM peptidoglycan-binding domain-containing protein [Clostridiaceae bacterium]RKI13155.1 LysM peptidoglycan-binding domain-containing protein [bacterium 1XD21-70]